jgi:DNA-binding transcriptional LysR family regulator
MHTNVLRYFLEIVRARSIRAAAENLHIAASALSRHVANLEHEFGVPLLERLPRGIRLTPAGEVFAAGAAQTLRQVDRIRSEIDDLRDLKRGHVVIYAVEGVVADFLLPVLSQFGRNFPNVTYHIEVTGTEQVLHALRNDLGDIGIAFNPNPDPQIEVVYDAKHPVYAVVSRKHPLASKKVLTIQELAKETLGLPDLSFGVRRLLDQCAAKDGIPIEPSLTINSIEMAKAYVRSGAGLSVLPAFAITRECSSGELVAVAIRDENLTHAVVSLCVQRSRVLSSAGQRLLVEVSAALKAFTAANFSIERKKKLRQARARH